MSERRIPQPHRVRKIEGSFAWIDHRLLRHGHLSLMMHQDQALYLFLCLAADRDGVSFYRQEKICDTLGLAWDEFHVARDRLIGLKLIAFEAYSATTPNGFYQVLPVDGRAADLATATLRQGPVRQRRERTARSDMAVRVRQPQSPEVALQSVAAARA